MFPLSVDEFVAEDGPGFEETMTDNGTLSELRFFLLKSEMSNDKMSKVTLYIHTYIGMILLTSPIDLSYPLHYITLPQVAITKHLVGT
jgi:hypothetical protein